MQNEIGYNGTDYINNILSIADNCGVMMAGGECLAEFMTKTRTGLYFGNFGFKDANDETKVALNHLVGTGRAQMRDGKIDVNGEPVNVKKYNLTRIGMDAFGSLRNYSSVVPSHHYLHDSPRVAAVD